MRSNHLWIGAWEEDRTPDLRIGRPTVSPPTARSEVRMLTRLAPRGSVQLCRSCSRAVMMVTVTAAHGQDRSYKGGYLFVSSDLLVDMSMV